MCRRISGDKWVSQEPCQVSVSHECPCRTWVGSQSPFSLEKSLLTHTALAALSATWAYAPEPQRIEISACWCDLRCARLQETWISNVKPLLLQIIKFKTLSQAVQYFDVPRNIRRSQDMTVNCDFFQQLEPDFFPSFVL